MENWYTKYDGFQRTVSDFFPPGHFNAYNKYKMLAFFYICVGEQDKAHEYLELFFEAPAGKYEPVVY